MSLTKSQTKAIRDHVLADVDDETKRLIALAGWDLLFGPITEPDDGMPWPGFEKACDAIRNALTIRDLYLDSQSDFVTETEPDWCEGCDNEECTGVLPEDWYHVEACDVRTIAVGKDLAPYVR